MTITYCVGSGLYINMTNRCTNDCVFCIRNFSNSVGDTDSLWLEREPSRDEILADIQKRDLKKYNEVVFCGYGEPTARLEDLLWLCDQLKQADNTLIRLNTNGQSSLIAGYDTAPLFAGLVDTISISLNAAGAEEYMKICKPTFGIKAYEAVLDFATKVRSYVPSVIMSVVNGTTDIEACRKIADNAELPLRVR